MKKQSLILFLCIGILVSINLILLFLFLLPNFELEKIVREEIKNVNIDGNCLEHTIVYEKIFKDLGIDTLRITLRVDEILEDDGMIHLKGHSFLIVYDETGYVILDQKNIGGIKYGK